MVDTAKETATPGDSAPDQKLDEGAHEIQDPSITEKQQDSDDFGGLFEDEPRPSEAELKGEQEAPTEEPEGKPQETESKPPDSEAKGEKAEEKKEEEKKEEPAEQKPPEGYVPKQALSEARGQMKALKEQLASLQAENASLKAAPAPAPMDESEFKDFKVLSKSEFNDLLDEDPAEAVRYQARLIEYKDFKKSKEAAETAKAQAQHELQNKVNEWTAKIAEIVPGIYDDNSEVGKKLAVFAEEHGFTDAAYLEAMTDPRTMIIPHGQNQTFLMGPGAANFLKLLSTAHKKISDADPDKLRQKFIDEETPKIVERVTKELTAKLKGAKAVEFKSLSRVPGGGEQIDSVGPLTEEQWAKLNPEEREKLLRET